MFYLLFHILLLKVLNHFIFLTDYRDVEMRKSVKVLFTASATFIAVIAVVYGYESETVELSSFRGLKNYISLLLTSIVMLLTFYFPSVATEQSEVTAPASEETEETNTAEENISEDHE